MEISWVGAIIALIVVIVLILYKVPVFFSMLAGALAGGIIGFIIWGATHSGTDWNNIVSVPINAMLEGGKGIMTSVLRILTAGILAGALIYTKAAKSIASKLVKVLGNNFTLLGLTITTMILTAAGVFIDVAVITIAPIALSVASKSKLSRSAMLIAMIGGGKAGNLMSPNPNAINAATTYQVDLIKVMGAGAMVAIVGVVVTYLITNFKNKKDRKLNNDIVIQEESKTKEEVLPKFWLSILGPIITVLILSLRPITNNAFNVPFEVDPLIALPIGGFVTIFALGHVKNTIKILNDGLKRMIPIAIMIAGTGMLSGIIKNSDLSSQIKSAFKNIGLPVWLLAPFSGILFGFATASTTAGTTVASKAFVGSVGIGVGGAAMTHAGATVLDSVPHGSFFHSTAGSVKMNAKERLKIIVWEACIGFSMTLTSTIIFGVIGLSF